jgi:hypothetical protein
MVAFSCRFPFGQAQKVTKLDLTPFAFPFCLPSQKVTKLDLTPFAFPPFAFPSQKVTKLDLTLFAFPPKSDKTRPDPFCLPLTPFAFPLTPFAFPCANGWLVGGYY